MLNPDDPLMPPQDGEMLSLEQLSSGGTLHDLATGAIDYYSFNTVVLPAFDDRDWPVFPRDEHILDALARRYDLVDEDDARLRPAAGVCAVCVELPDCDFCAAVAQYETHIEGTVAPTCVRCTREYGDGRLGAGHSVYLMHKAEVPHAVREIADEISQWRKQPSIWHNPNSDDPQWCDVLCEIGFVGPDASGAMRAWLFGTLALAEPDPRGGFQLEAHRHDGRVSTLPGGGPILPGDLDPLQIREEILRQVRRTVPSSQRDQLQSVLRPSVPVATKRALATMIAGTYTTVIDRDSLIQYRTHHRYGTLSSAERTAAKVAASQSTDPVAVSRLATEHPDPEIRTMAVNNPSCSDAALLRCAHTDQSQWVRNALLQRPSVPDGLIEALAVNVLTNGPVQLHTVLRLLLNPECPAQFQAALMDRVYRAGPQFRLSAAWEAHHAAPERRDYIHEQLLSRAIRIPHTVDLIDAVLGPDGLANQERIAWMLHHPNRRIRRLVSHYRLRTGLPEQGTLGDGLRTIGQSNRLTTIEDTHREPASEPDHHPDATA